MDQSIAILRSIIKHTRVEELLFRFRRAEGPQSSFYSTLPTASIGNQNTDLPLVDNITTLRIDCGHCTRVSDTGGLYLNVLIANCTRLVRLEVNLEMACPQVFEPTLVEGNTVNLPLEHLFMRGIRDGLSQPGIFSRHLRRLKTFGFQAPPYRNDDVSWSLMAQYKIWPTQLYVRPHVELGSSAFFQYLKDHPGLESLYYIESLTNGAGEDDASTLQGLLTALVPRHVDTLKELELFDSSTSWALSWPGHPDATETMKNQLGQLSSLRRFAIRIDWSMHRDFCPSNGVSIFCSMIYLVG